MLTQSYSLSGAGAASGTTAAIDLGENSHAAYQCVFSGTDVVGSLQMQTSNDDATWINHGDAVAVADSADKMVSSSTVPGRYVRIAWTFTSGTGNLAVTAIAKQASRAVGT